jgi:hypothetical protein
MAANSVNGLWAKFVTAAKADPKKAGFLGVLAVVMVFLWVRYMAGSSGPSGAIAASADATPAATTDNPPPMSPSATHALKALQDWTRSAVAPSARNIFAVHYGYFPTDGKSPASSGDGFSDPAQKSRADLAEEKAERDARRAAIKRDAAADVRLQSILMGDVPKAMVNETLVREGDMITKYDGDKIVSTYRVLKIDGKGIVVIRDGVRIEIDFK